jgi:transposase
MREKFKPEQTRRMEAEQALHKSNLEISRLKLENQQLRDQFIEQSKLQDALSEAKTKIRKLEKELNRRSGREDPYGLATPSSKKVNKPNSTPENQAKRGGAKKGHKGHGRKDFSPEEADRTIHLKNVPAPCGCGGIWLDGGKVRHCVYHYIPAKLEKRIYYKNVCVCSLCGERIVGQTPGVMPNSFFSNSMIAFLLAEHYFHGATIGNLEQRHGINHGTFIGIAHRVAALLENAFEKIMEALRGCKLVHADETGWMMDGKKAYAWIFANDIFRAFLFRDTRGSVVPLEVFGEALLKLILVTDRYCGYSPLKLLHQFCYVHLMRDVKKLELEFPEDKEIAKFVNDLNPLLAKAIGLRNEDLSLKEHQEKAIELKDLIMEICE